MLSSLVFTALAALSFVSAQTANVCGASQYASLGCLTEHPSAARICWDAPTQTITLTVTTTTLDVNTVETTQHATSQTTIQETKTEMTTKTVTRGPVKTITSVKTKVTTEVETFTTYVAPTQEPVVSVAAATCETAEAIDALTQLPGARLATACSCIGQLMPSATVTSTITAAAVQTLTTDVAGTAPTTTVYNIVRSTITQTVRPKKTITKKTTVCTTSTTIEAYAAPTFTQVYGPKAGCADTAKGPSKKLEASVSNLKKATAECQSLCEQDADCSFVYVQRMFANDGTQYFQCSFNDHQLDIDSDLNCGRKAGVYGVAVGYDANDRGTVILEQ
ncbi:hypothetical protein LTR37_011972 [Vermiconidia calcicola]|uniref:Uncharacterized protein n=1 Tax=Vermiconidia calcicola TaxID=1690605 RepID=A0ACC3N0L4_9PEZI|nr:hypothetical protein LTR37_011972 [Vermiconidia calcicola]